MLYMLDRLVRKNGEGVDQARLPPCLGFVEPTRPIIHIPKSARKKRPGVWPDALDTLNKNSIALAKKTIDRVPY